MHGPCNLIPNSFFKESPQIGRMIMNEAERNLFQSPNGRHQGGMVHIEIGYFDYAPKVNLFHRQCSTLVMRLVNI